MIAVLWPQPNARSVHQPEPTAFGLPMGDFQPLGSPDPLDPLVVDLSSKPGAIAQRPYDSRSGRPDAPRRHGHAGRCVALSDAARAPHRHDALRHAAALGPAQCRHAGLTSFAGRLAAG
jgi:hypothetical protein